MNDEEETNLVQFRGRFRHGQDGYFHLRGLPHWPSLAETALSTGWWELDQIWKIYPGQFTVVTGIAGHGKSTFLLNVVCNMARQHGTRSFLYVPENEPYLRSKMEAIWDDKKSFNDFAENNCFVQSSIPETYDSAARTLQWVLDRAVVAIEKDQVDLLLLDPWNELERARRKDQTMTDYIGECLMYLKQFCRVHSVAIILVAHPTKAGVEQGKTPGLADIEGSMNWFNKCDNGLIISRENDKPTAKVISAKVREVGAGRRGVCYFMVDEATGKFTPQYGAQGNGH